MWKLEYWLLCLKVNQLIGINSLIRIRGDVIGLQQGLGDDMIIVIHFTWCLMLWLMSGIACLYSKRLTIILNLILLPLSVYKVAVRLSNWITQKLVTRVVALNPRLSYYCLKRSVVLSQVSVTQCGLSGQK